MYVTQYRAMFVFNCKTITDKILSQAKTKHQRKSKHGMISTGSDEGTPNAEILHPVCCSVCSTEVGVFDKDEVYHFFNVIPSNAWTVVSWFCFKWYHPCMVTFWLPKPNMWTRYGWSCWWVHHREMHIVGLWIQWGSVYVGKGYENSSCV